MSDILVDTFTGTGNLSTHTPETNTWVIGTRSGLLLTHSASPPLTTLANWQLNGSGQVRLNQSNSATYPLESILEIVTDPPGANYTSYIDLIIPAGGTTNGNLNLQIGVFGRAGPLGSDPTGNSKGIGFVFELWEASSTDRRVQSWLAWNSDDSGGSLGITDLHPPANGNLSIGSATAATIEVVFSGRTMQAYIDAVLISSISWATAAADIDTGSLQYEFKYINNGGIAGSYSPVLIDRIATSPGVESPPAFWTDFVLSQEIDS